MSGAFRLLRQLQSVHALVLVHAIDASATLHCGWASAPVQDCRGNDQNVNALDPATAMHYFMNGADHTSADRVSASGAVSLILRSYIEPGGTHQLRHCRVLPRDANAHNLDSARYRGLVIPTDILCQVYEAAGQLMTWTTTKQETRFGLIETGPSQGEVVLEREDAAWGVLKEWDQSCSRI